mmetsp:Transcript_18849/g.44016  ORF Transcript_18849/g.44016 Transcript_18849/m.44016 type:complete len:251 (+) Transcript_18849:347-1099(+)
MRDILSHEHQQWMLNPRSILTRNAKDKVSLRVPKHVVMELPQQFWISAGWSLHHFVGPIAKPSPRCTRVETLPWFSRFCRVLGYTNGLQHDTPTESLGSVLHQPKRVGRTDAASQQVAFRNLQMIQQRHLILPIGVPSVILANGSSGRRSIRGKPLIHTDQEEMITVGGYYGVIVLGGDHFQFVPWIPRRYIPLGNGAPHPTRCQEQYRDSTTLQRTFGLIVNFGSAWSMQEGHGCRTKKSSQEQVRNWE